MEIDRRQYIRSSDIDVSETERKEKTVMANESSRSSSSSSSSSNGKKGRFRLFGVELNPRIRDEEEEMKKMKKKKEIDGGFEKIPETSRQSKKGIVYLSNLPFLFLFSFVFFFRKPSVGFLIRIFCFWVSFAVIQWSREEHKRFLIGLKEKGRGNWKEIAVKYVKTRNKSQVASHAQKYYLHQKASHQNKQRRSVFDMSPEPVIPSTPSSLGFALLMFLKIMSF